MLCSSCRSPIATRLLTRLAKLATARGSNRLFHASVGRTVAAAPGYVSDVSLSSLRAGTIVSRNPLSTTGDDILSSITPSAFSSRHSHRSSTAVLLCSRAFASLASDAEFLQNFITRLIGVHETNSHTELGWSVNVLSAVVDHVSIPTAKSSSHNQSTHTFSKAPTTPPNNFEGITYLFDFSGQTLGLSEALAANPASESGASPQDELGCVSLRTSNSKLNPHRITTLQLPLANTLFVNGSPSTLIISQWSISKDGKNLVNDNAQPRATFFIDLPDKFSATPGTWGFPASTSLYIPIKSLTPPRTVSDSSGNVVRRLDGNDSTSQTASSPASIELEQAIAQYFSESAMTPRSIPVWGLVVPHRLRDSWSEGDIEPSLLIQRGASLHRVLSGGGGWGENAGLISLDYRTEFGQPASSSDMHAPIFDENASNLKSSFGGAVVSPGDMLQFYVLDTVSPQAVQSNTTSSPSMQRLVLQVGVSEAINEGDPNGSDSNQVNIAEPSSAAIEAIDDHFGALSESGIALSQFSPDGIVFAKSRIDAPHAAVSFQYTQPIEDKNGGVANRETSHLSKRQQSNINDDTNVIRRFPSLPQKLSVFRKILVGQSPASTPEMEATADEAPMLQDTGRLLERAKAKARAVKYHSQLQATETRREGVQIKPHAAEYRRSRRGVKKQQLKVRKLKSDSTARVFPGADSTNTQPEVSITERKDEIFELFNEVMGRRK